MPKQRLTPPRASSGDSPWTIWKAGLFEDSAYYALPKPPESIRARMVIPRRRGTRIALESPSYQAQWQKNRQRDRVENGAGDRLIGTLHIEPMDQRVDREVDRHHPVVAHT